MLVTTCKHCQARFRVTPEQLNVSQGQVRCGECRGVFNGFESLERFPGDDTGTRLLASRAAPAPPPAPAAPVPVPVALDDIPDLTAETGELPPASESSPAPAPEPEPEAEPQPPAPEPASDGTARASRPAPAPPREQEAEPLVLLPPEPPPRPSRAWAFGVALMTLLLAVQAIYAFRAELAQRYPVTRPFLESACAAVGCRVPWVNDERALKLEDSELLEVPGRPGQIALQARVRNLSSSAQEFPHLELTLTDVTGQTAVRRVLRPRDYLGRLLAPGEVMPAGSEALLSVRIETGDLRPTGYELLLFYP